MNELTFHDTIIKSALNILLSIDKPGFFNMCFKKRSFHSVQLSIKKEERK